MPARAHENLQDLRQRLFLSVSEVAFILGVSTRQVHRWIERGLLPAVRVGRLVRIREEDLNAFIQRHRTVPEKDVEGR